MVLKPILEVVRLLLGLVVPLLLLTLLMRPGNRSARTTGDGQVVFAPSRIQIGAWILMVFCVTFLTADMLLKSRQDFVAVVTELGLGVFWIFLLFSFPGTVISDDDGLRQIYWLSKNKHIPWREIVEINVTGKRDCTVTVTGANRTKIVNSGLPDSAQLLREIGSHCRESLPPEFPPEYLPS